MAAPYTNAEIEPESSRRQSKGSLQPDSGQFAGPGNTSPRPSAVSKLVGRKSRAYSLVILDPTDNVDASELHSKAIPVVVCVMEVIYQFVWTCLDVYCIYGLCEFAVVMDTRVGLLIAIEAKYIGSLVALPVAMVCDSYLGSYYPVLLLHILLLVPLVISFVTICPTYMLSSTVKLKLAGWSIKALGIFEAIEPVRIANICTVVCEQKRYFINRRSFFAIYVFSINIGIAAGAIAVHCASRSRTGYSIVNLANVIFLCLYIAFWIAFRQFFRIRRGPRMSVEKSLLNLLCYFMKKLDRWILRSMIFRKRMGWEDFRCIWFNSRTVRNTTSMLGVVMVLTPLLVYFGLIVLVKELYYVQVSLMYYEAEPFPFIATKALCFLLIMPFFECFCASLLNKASSSFAGKQLVLVGVGAFIMSFALIWTSIVQHVVKANSQGYFIAQRGNKAEMTLIHTLPDTIKVRSPIYSRLTAQNLDEWIRLKPLVPLTAMDIPQNHLHLEVENLRMGLYDEIEINVSVSENNWFVLMQQGIAKLPQNCFASGVHTSMNPMMYPPGQVCVLCAMSVCRGYVVFNDLQHGLQMDLELDKLVIAPVRIDMAGKFLVRTRIGDNYLKGNFTYTFESLASYLLVVYENETIDELEDEEDDSDEDDADDLGFSVNITVSGRSASIFWMFLTVLIHAISDVFAQASLIMFLFFAVPHDVRATMFAYATELLSFPTYLIIYRMGPTTWQNMPAIIYFTLGCVNCLFIIVYFLAVIFFIHRLNRTKLPHTVSSRGITNIQSYDDTRHQSLSIGASSTVRYNDSTKAK